MVNEVKIKKIKVVWREGEETIFEGSFQWYSKNLWIINYHTETPIYIPAGQVRYIQVVE